jgi:hypothetical protein
VADGVLRRRKIDAGRRRRVEGVEGAARTGLHEDGRHRDGRREAEERRATFHADVEDRDLDPGNGIDVSLLLRQFVKVLDSELELEVAEVTTIRVAPRDDGRRRGRLRRFLCPRVAGERPHEAGGAHHHADDAGDPASPPVD